MAAPSASLSPAAIALNRFGLGARPDDSPPANPKHWLGDQFDSFDVTIKLNLVCHRVLQACLEHRNIQNTARYTALAPDRFKGFRKDWWRRRSDAGDH
jgi:uncharacterized protein (DUF1800 family)